MNGAYFKKFYFIYLLLFCACTEAPLFLETKETGLNSPHVFKLISATDFAIVGNANVNFSNAQGSLVAVDLTTNTIIESSKITVPNFIGDMSIDQANQKIYISSRSNDSVLVYSYSIPGTDGNPISFSRVEVSSNKKIGFNEIKTDEEPTGTALASNTNKGELLMVANSISGSINFIKTSNFNVLDLDAEDERLLGLRLESASNFHIDSPHPGVGANQIIPDPTGRLFYITSTRSNSIYVVDAYDQNIEAMIPLTSLANGVGTRDIALTSTGVALVIHKGLNALLMLDVSNIVENGIDYEEVDPILIRYVFLDSDPEALALTADEQTVYVVSRGTSVLQKIDVPTGVILENIVLPGSTPGKVVLDEGRDRLYITNFLSDTISVLELSSDTLIDEIK